MCGSIGLAMIRKRGGAAGVELRPVVRDRQLESARVREAAVREGARKLDYKRHGDQ